MEITILEIMELKRLSLSIRTVSCELVIRKVESLPTPALVGDLKIAELWDVEKNVFLDYRTVNYSDVSSYAF